MTTATQSVELASKLQNIPHGSVTIVGGCVVARYGDCYYTAGKSCNVIRNAPRTLRELLTFIVSRA